MALTVKYMILILYKDLLINFSAFIGCQKDVLTNNQYTTFYDAKNFYDHDGIFEMLVRFKGIADGHIILTTNASDAEPRYTVSNHSK